jgi:hypothetical protein
MVAAGIAVAVPMAVFMARHPEALFVRLKGMSIFTSGASRLEVAELFASNYLSHFGLDFLFRTGQPSHHHWHNIGTGFISLWMLFPLVFGVMVLWRERRRPFFRFLLLVLLAAPIPASMTTDDVPHPNRIIHLVPILVLVCALGVQHLLAQLRPSRRAVAVLLALVSFEGAAMAHQYFTQFPHIFDGDNPGGSDGGRGAALRLAFAQRRGGAPMYLPPPFFDFDGMLIGFWGDLDPREMRAHGPAGSGVHSTDEPVGPRVGLPSGTLWVTEGAGAAPFAADVVGAVERRPDSGGGTLWTIYRKR